MMQISSIRNRRGIAQNFRGITMTKKQYFEPMNDKLLKV